MIGDDYENLSESELAIRAARNDDENAFGEIVRRFSPRVFRVAGRFFRQYGLVEEAAQETFLKAFTQIGKFEARGSMEGWLTRIALTTCLNLIRTAKKQAALNFSGLTSEEAVWLEERIVNSSIAGYKSDEEKLIAADLIERLLDKLSPADATLLIMLDGEGESIKTIAETINLSESNVKVRAFRARKKLRETLEELLKND